MGNYLGKNDRDPCADDGDDDGGNDVGPPLGSGEASVGCLEEWRRQRCRLLPVMRLRYDDLYLPTGDDDDGLLPGQADSVIAPT